MMPIAISAHTTPVRRIPRRRAPNGGSNIHCAAMMKKPPRNQPTQAMAEIATAQRNWYATATDSRAATSEVKGASAAPARSAAAAPERS